MFNIGVATLTKMLETMSLPRGNAIKTCFLIMCLILEPQLWPSIEISVCKEGKMLLKFSYIQLIKHIPKNIHIYLMILKRELTIQDQFKTLGYSMKLEKCAIYVSLVCNGFTYILFLILVPNVTSTANG